MIIQNLTLLNIGVFGERTVLDLSPRRGRPITLVGGVNGSGKTTIMESIQWCLYGSLAKTPRRIAPETTSYPHYLRRLRNRTAPIGGEAYAEMRLTVRRGHRMMPITVKRSIRSGKSRCSDHLEVTIDGTPLANAGAEWPVQMDGILPNQLSTLFFFDAEQIEGMVDPTQSKRFLRAGLHALLGIDLIDQLVADLTTLQRRRRAETAPPKRSQQIESLEEQLKQLDSMLVGAREREAEARAEHDRSELVLDAAEENFRRRGGEQFERRDETKSDLSRAEAERLRLRDSMRALANGPLPMALISAEIASLHEELTGHESRSRARARTASAEEVLSELRTWLLDRGVPEETQRVVDEFRASWREANPSNGAASSIAGLATDGEAASRTDALLSGGLVGDALEAASALLRAMQGVERTIANLSRSLATLPEDEDVASLQGAVKAGANRCAAARAGLRAAETESKRLEFEWGRLDKTLGKELEKVADQQNEATRVTRTVEYCNEMQGVLEAFRRSVVKSNLRRIESSIWRKFQRLMHKKGLGVRAHINPDTYELSVLSGDGQLLPPERLSAGERQLLATSVLWGLADASGRKLPVVIDTPLGRLDGSHRGRLVEEYFPSAARQVVLLSTDEEIVEKWYRELEPSLARAYTLEFDDASQTSRLRAGYFEEAHSVA